LKDGDKNLRLKAIHTDKDKITRAWKLSPLFEDKRVFFRKNLTDLIDLLVLFPNFRYKDGFDALDLAVTASKLKRRKKRRSEEPGVL
jgi:phage terminase large subunit-like protein